jgi:hypothetical protein
VSGTTTITVTPANLIASQYVPNSQTTMFTSGSGSNGTVFKKVTFTNVTASPVTVSVNRVPFAGTAATSNLVMDAVTIPPVGQTYIANELNGVTLGLGDFLSMVASAANAVVVTASGYTF